MPDRAGEGQRRVMVYYTHTPMPRTSSHLEETFLNPARIVAAAGVHEGMKVADFGCGSGFFARAAAHAVGPRGEVWAIDVDRPMLARLAALSRIEGLEAQMHVLPGNVERRGGSGLPDASVDLVIATNILFSAHNKQTLAAEILRVLKNGQAGTLGGSGRAVIIDWTDSFSGLGPPVEHIINKEAALELFIQAGFIPVQELPAGSHHWGFIVRKK